MTVWTYHLLTPMGRDGATVQALDEDGESVSITFASEDKAQQFYAVAEAISSERAPWLVRIDLKVVEDEDDDL